MLFQEEYWPNNALRLAKDTIGSSDVAVPEADEVGPIYRRVAERILANLTTKYPWYAKNVWRTSVSLIEVLLRCCCLIPT